MAADIEADISNVCVRVRNVERLAGKCDDILAGNARFRGQEWKIVKYVQSLADKIEELENRFGNSVNPDQLASFKSRLAVLQEVQQQQQQHVTHPTGEPSLAECTPPRQQQRPLDSPQLHGSGLLRRVAVSREQSMREELFARHHSEDIVTIEGKRGVGEILERHHRLQEQVAGDMIEMAHSLRAHTETARDIIRSDVKRLQHTSEVADDNITQLQRGTDRLSEKNQSCSWGTWILLTIVVIVFLNMIVFIRFSSK